MVMIKVNVHEAKTHFSEYLAKIEQGESVVICKRNIPIVEMKAIVHPSLNPRPIGLAKNIFVIPDTFFDELPPEITSAFYKSKNF